MDSSASHGHPGAAGGLRLSEVLISVSILVVVVIALYPVPGGDKRMARGAASSSNARQIALAAIMYSGDHDEKIVPSVNGWISRLQDRSDKTKTASCPDVGTQRQPAPDAAGARPSRSWVHLLEPYIKARGLFYDPQRERDLAYFNSPPATITDRSYTATLATYRNQGLFPQYGMNYMFLSPLRAEERYRSDASLLNHAAGEVHKMSEAVSQEATVFFTASQRTISDSDRGFYVVNAPGMWNAFMEQEDGYVAYWEGTKGSGDWVGTKTACGSEDRRCREPTTSTGSAYVGLNGKVVVTFLDGHVKRMLAAELAAGTDYAVAVAGATDHPGSGAKIIDKKAYLWDLDGGADGP